MKNLGNFSSKLLNQAQKLFDLAVKANIKIASAESCTGGLIASLITEISGSSQIFERGFVVYSNLAKEQNLGVDAEILKQFGAVSEKAIGAIKNSAANISIAVTGISGPDGGSDDKPVGLVYISSFNNLNKKLIVKKFNFSGSRSENRILTVQNAFKILISQIND